MKTLNQLTSESITYLYSNVVSISKISAGEWEAKDTDDNPVAIDQELVDAEVTRLQAEYDAQQYARDRQYPSTGDQLDMIFHAIEAGTLDTTSEFFTTLKAVKDANPKA
jgi:hypothetical protein